MDDWKSAWKYPPEQLSLRTGDVHVWLIPLNLSSSWIDRLWLNLSEDERQKAERFVFQRDRNRYVVARGYLRNILARYLSIRAQDIYFRYSSYGKPELSEAFQGHGLNFNLSHSRDLGLLGITLGALIGVDIEYLRSDLADEGVARRYFSDLEVAELLSLPVDLRTQGFFNCWTRKEAYIKAIGEGLSMPLDQFDVTLVPGKPAALLNTRPDAQEAQEWSLFSVSLDPEYVGALAVKAQNVQLHFWYVEYITHNLA